MLIPNPLVMTLATVAARRRLLLEMARRRAQPGTGSARVFLEERTAMTCWPDLAPYARKHRQLILSGETK